METRGLSPRKVMEKIREEYLKQPSRQVENPTDSYLFDWAYVMGMISTHYYYANKAFI
jgi:hypothetical protein